MTVGNVIGNAVGNTLAVCLANGMGVACRCAIRPGCPVCSRLSLSGVLGLAYALRKSVCIGVSVRYADGGRAAISLAKTSGNALSHTATITGSIAATCSSRHIPRESASYSLTGRSPIRDVCDETTS